MDEHSLPISVFISYAHESTDFVRHLRNKLEEKGIRVWHDEAVFRLGDSFIEKLETTLKQTDAIICVISENYSESKWPTYENIIFRRQRQESQRDIFIIPILIDDTPLPVQFSGQNAIDFRKDFNTGIEVLIESLTRKFPNRQKYERVKIDLPEVSLDLFGRRDIVEQALEALKSPAPRVIIISGPRGSGKTTLARLIVRKSDNLGLFSKLIFMDAWSCLSYKSLKQELHSRLSTEEITEEAVLQEKVLIVLDGVDRFPLVERKSIYGLLDDLISNRLATHIILTTDMNLTTEIQVEQLHLTFQPQIIKLAPLTDEDITKFIETRIKESRDRPKILEIIRSNRHLSDLCTNPLMLRFVVNQLHESGLQTINLESMLEQLLQKCSSSERDILRAMVHFKSSVSARTIGTFAGIKDIGTTNDHLENLVSKGIITRIKDKYEFTHMAIREYCEGKLRDEHIYEQGGTLYVTIDPTLFTKEDTVEFLESLNELYVLAGGEELIIREDEVGRFIEAEVLV